MKPANAFLKVSLDRLEFDLYVSNSNLTLGCIILSVFVDYIDCINIIRKSQIETSRKKGEGRVEFALPEYMVDLCSVEHIKPFSYYLNRDSWIIHSDRVEKAFLNKKGVYCFWWSGSRESLVNDQNVLNHAGHRYSIDEDRTFGHTMIPLYVGMTAKAAQRNGGRLTGRLIDRLTRFPKVFQEYKRGDRFELCKRKTGTCGNFDLFNFPERIRAALAIERNAPNLTLEEAEVWLIHHPRLITRFAEEYKDIFYNNYSIAFVPFTDDVEMFYAEALAIGYLRPWLNHS